MTPHREKQLLKFLHGLYAPRGAHQLIEFILQSIPDITDCHSHGIARYDPVRLTILQMNLDTPFIFQGATATIRFTLMRHWGGDGHLLAEETSVNWHLTPREQEVLHWVRVGKSDREIATILDLTHHTVKEHLRRIYRKTGTHTRTAAARLVTPHPTNL